MLKFIKENISKLPDYHTRSYYYPFTYIDTNNLTLLSNMTGGIKDCEDLVDKIQENTKQLNRIQQRQNILAFLCRGNK